MTTPQRILVIGLGMGPTEFPPEVREAQVLAGGRRQLAAHPDLPGRRVELGRGLAAALDELAVAREAGQRVVVLADGDPLYFGIGARLAERFGPDNLDFRTGVSCLQGLAARLGLPWAEVVSLSLHGREDTSPLLSAVTFHPLVAVLGDDVRDPAFMARLLAERGAEGVVLHVAEDLGLPAERVRTLTPTEAAAETFSPLSVVLVQRVAPARVPLRLGVRDMDLATAGGLFSKWWLRAAAVAALDLRDGQTLWDLGAGSGAVALEAAAVLRRGRVLAVERDSARVELIRENIRRTQALHVQVIEGFMPDCLPECLADQPTPERIFIGGGLGGQTGPAVLEAACQALAQDGILVASAILLGSLELLTRELTERGFDLELTQLSGARAQPLAGDLRLAGDNPVFLVRASRPEPEEPVEHPHPL